MFFLDGLLHRKIRIINSDNSVVAWCYQEESRKWYPRNLVRRNFQKAYTINQAAKLMRTQTRRLKEVFDKGLFKPPERTYNLSNYAPGKGYINQEDMLELRQVVWDTLPKNRFGEPTNDTMANELELEQAMKRDDDREFLIEGDEIIRIYRNL